MSRTALRVCELQFHTVRIRAMSTDFADNGLELQV